MLTKMMVPFSLPVKEKVELKSEVEGGK